jgi:starch synthase
VAASLPKALAALGVDVRIVMPLYDSVERERWGLVRVEPVQVRMGGGEVNGCGLWRTMAEGGVPVYFLEHERYYARGGIYDRGGEAYGDQAWRFGLLCRASMQLCEERGWMPDVVHVHDWPTALLAAMMASRRAKGEPFGRAGCVLTIHNQCYQGYCPASALGYLGLGDEVWHGGALESYGQINALKGGIACANAVTTVSPGYAREILREPGGCGLSGLLRSRGDAFEGVLNGADYDVWNPEGDGRLAMRYGAATAAEGKAACKRALQEEMGLEADLDAPLFGMVCRLAEQKGTGLLREALPRALDMMKMQVVVLGAGNPADEDFLRRLAAEWPGRVGVKIGYSDALSHRIMAGSDFFMMPSLYEPCGLTQLYAMRYGSLPVVHATGGLDDTVEQYNEGTGEGTGFKFYDASGRAFFDVIGWAVSTWFDRKEHLRTLRRRAMGRRFDWETSAKRYLEIYRRVAEDGRRAAGKGP